MLDLALIPATAGRDFPPLRLRRIPREARKSLPAALHCVPAPSGCGSIASGLSTAIEVAMVAARETEEDTNMATIGNFTANGNGFVGTIKTLALGTIKAKLVPAERTSEKAPDFRVFAGAIEFGAGWKKKSEQGRDYVSLKFDDPSFPNPIYATMVEVEGEEGYPVIWSRPNRD